MMRRLFRIIPAFDLSPILIHVIKDGNEARYNVEPIVLVFFLMRRFYVVRAWTDETCLWVETKDGQRVCTPFSKWKRLESATKDQRNDFVLGYTGIHWPSIDEDLGYEGLFVDAGLCEATPEECSVVCEPLLS